MIQLQDSLDDYIAGLNSSCLSTKAATAPTEAKLARFGFTGWTVTVRNEAPCTNSDVIDPGSKTVTLIRAEPRPRQRRHARSSPTGCAR